VEAEVDRGITHEWVRHRIGAYTQESTRFVNYGKEGQEARFIFPDVDNDWQRGVLGQVLEEATRTYKALLVDGLPPQIARSVLPNALASRLIVTYNLRSWRHFLIMRTSREAHPQMKQVTVPLLGEFQSKIPILFEDIQPGMRQAEAMRLLR
jgi:thymidylate synthase (FAD)